MRKKYAYFVDGQEIELKVDQNSLAVCFNHNVDFLTRREIFNGRSAGDNFSFRNHISSESFSVLSMPSSVIREAYQSYDNLFSEFKSLNEIKDVKPIFKLGSARIFASNECTIKFKDFVNTKILEDFRKKYNFYSFSRNDCDENAFTFKCADKDDVFDYFEILQEDKSIDYVDPVFFIKYSDKVKTSLFDSRSKLIPAFKDALSMINAIEARKRVSGLENIKIGLLDTGIDERHPNLHPNIGGIYNAIDDKFEQGTLSDSHGTAVASLMAGVDRNGFKGVADGAKIFSAKIAGNEINYDPQYAICRALDWIQRNNVDIVNISYSFPKTKCIEKKLNELVKNGRNGKGTIIISAAGDNTRFVDFPASLDGIIAVSSCDSRFYPINDSNKYSWFAPNSPKILVSAPGVNVYAADLVGVAGDFNGDFMLSGFSGTSCSAPLVSGQIALLLSINNNLKNSDIIKILIASSNKVNTVNYDINNHNSYLGFGVIDCLTAINSIIPA